MNETHGQTRHTALRLTATLLGLLTLGASQVAQASFLI